MGRWRFFGCCCASVYFDWYWGVINVSETPATDYIAMTTAVFPEPSDPADSEQYNSWTDAIANRKWKVDMPEEHSAVTLTLVRFSTGDETGGGDEKVFYHRTDDTTTKSLVGHFNGTTELLVWEHEVSTNLVWVGAPTDPVDYDPPTFADIAGPGIPWTSRSSSGYADLVVVLHEVGEGLAIGFPGPWNNDWANVASPYVGIPPTSQENENDQVNLGAFTNYELIRSAVSVAPNSISFFAIGTERLVDVIVTYTSEGESAEVGSNYGPDWLDIEWPGFDGTLAGTLAGDLSDLVDTANGGERICRIYCIPPRATPNCFGVKHPRPKLFVSSYYDDEPLYVESQMFLEQCGVYLGAYVADADHTVPIKGPGGIVVWEEEYETARLLVNQQSFNSTQPGWSTIFPYALNATVFYGDCNEQVDWGCIFGTMEREINVSITDAHDPLGELYYENVTSETVKLRIRLGEGGANGSGDQRSWNCYREADLQRAFDLYVLPKLEASQGLSSDARYAVWIERNYDPEKEPTSSVAGEWKSHQVVLWRLGGSMAWSFSDMPETSTNPDGPGIMWASDRFLYLRDFRYQFTEAMGAKGAAINQFFSRWLISFKWDAENNRPAIMYPARLLETVETAYPNTYDVPKTGAKNRIYAPALQVRHTK